MQSLNHNEGGKSISTPTKSFAVEDANLLLKKFMDDTLNLLDKELKIKLLHMGRWWTFQNRMARIMATGRGTAIIWQTGTIQGDFELCGCSIHVDFIMN